MKPLQNCVDTAKSQPPLRCRGIRDAAGQLLALCCLTLAVVTLGACASAPHQPARRPAPAAAPTVVAVASDAQTQVGPTTQSSDKDASTASEPPTTRIAPQPTQDSQPVQSAPAAEFEGADAPSPANREPAMGAASYAATAAPADNTLAPAEPATTSARTAEKRTASEGDTQGVLAVEPRVVEVEFPGRMRLGDSDVVRAALVPDQDGYVLVTEIDGSTTITKSVIVRRPEGYRVSAIGLLTGVNFDVDQPERMAEVPPGERIDFRWSINARQAGAQRLTLEIKLRWTPLNPSEPQPADSVLYGRSLPVQVDSVFGMSSAQASQAGVAGLALGIGVGLFALLASPRGRRVRQTLGFAEPNPKVMLEPQASMALDAGESSLLQTLFRRYARVVLEREFRSGYSGARTFLALPIREDGRADAYTIAKIGSRAAIQQEYDNYDRFVKDTLPPITARIQETPLAIASGDKSRAILRYTFIGEPGKLPVSLREALLVNPDPAPLHRLFDTFGPNWWMQRKPYSFRLAEEYDRMLPAHYVIERIEPTRQVTGVLDGSLPPELASFAVGDVLTLRNFPNIERRPDGSGFSLAGAPKPGQAQLRVRFNTESQTSPSEPLYGRVTATRESLLRSYVQGQDRYGLPDPLLRVPELLNESVQGTQSTLHGDLNLENVLIGLGGIVWLIDFANTRDGHTLADFAHLEADVIAHVIAPQVADPRAYLNLAAGAPQFDALRIALRSLGLRCLFNPSQPREYDLALMMACLGALKYRNLNAHQRHILYLTAAQLRGITHD